MKVRTSMDKEKVKRIFVTIILVLMSLLMNIQVDTYNTEKFLIDVDQREYVDNSFSNARVRCYYNKTEIISREIGLKGKSANEPQVEGKKDEGEKETFRQERDSGFFIELLWMILIGVRLRKKKGENGKVVSFNHKNKIGKYEIREGETFEIERLIEEDIKK